MTGICGWSNVKHGGLDPKQRIERMCAELLGNVETDFAILRDCAIGGSVDGLAVTTDPSVIVAIEGYPRWPGAEFADMAMEAGPARALLELYLRNGADFLGGIQGAFALAVLDERSKSLLVAIDRMGIRPMCFADTRAGGLIFGQNTWAVLGHGGISDELSPQSLYNYMYFHVIPSPRTVFESVRKLQPGQRLLHVGGEVHVEEYWRPIFPAGVAAKPAVLREQLIETTRTAVTRCIGDSNTGCFLSGGLDSSTVSGFAAQLMKEPVPAYSIGFAQPGYDEMRYAKAAAGHFGLRHREYYVTPDDVADSLQLIASLYDEPFGNASALPAYFCAKKAREDGISRLLAGDGGDELFAGNIRYAEQRIFEMYKLIPAVLRSHMVEPAVMRFPMGRNILLHKMRRYVEQARVRMPERLQSYNYLHMHDPSTVFDTGFLQSVDINTPIEELREWYDRTAGRGLVDRMMLLDWKLTLADNDLRKVNRSSEAGGVEVLYPFLDEDLVALSVQIPAKLKIVRNNLRAFYKDAFAEFLPSEVLRKSKHGFGLPIGEWLAESKRLQDVVLPSIDRLRGRRIFDATFLDNVLSKHRTEHAAFYGNIIWVLTMLDYWLATRPRHQ